MYGCVEDFVGTVLKVAVDFGDSWVSQINKTRHKDKVAQAGIKYPRIIEAKGKKPVQYPNWEYVEE